MFQCGFFGRFPEVAFQVHTRLNDFDAFAFEEFSLEGSVRLADENFSALADNAMPGNTFSGRSGGQWAFCGVRGAWDAHGVRQRPLRKNPGARKLLRGSKEKS